ncbi:hypothetical protein [Priestia megaterium]|uniref:hypothetical protein n=1 Tax=Priestia megaterium TaxID=1404 RepID=UPI003012D84A
MNNFDEIFDRAFKKVGAEEKLKKEFAEKERFSKLTLKQKYQELNKTQDEQIKFMESAIKRMEAETAQLKKEREEREYYENHVKKYGNEL